MTAIIWNVERDRTTLAMDSRCWRAQREQPGGLASKFHILPAFHAALAGGGYQHVAGQALAGIAVGDFADVDALREGLPDVLRRCWRKFTDEDAPAAGLEVEAGTNFWLFTAGRADYYADKLDFRRYHIPPGAYCDPPINGRQSKLPRPPRTDADFLAIMRRQRPVTAKPNGHPIGGLVTRATITPDGIEVRTIGDLEIAHA